jgi:hypothetical protein
VREYLAVFDDAAFGAATPVVPKFISPADPAGALDGCEWRFGRTQYRHSFATPREGVDQDGFIRYRASKHDCDVCPLKPRCCPGQPARKIPHSVHEGARDMARDLALTEPRGASAKKIEMPFAQLKRILKLGRLRLRGPNGAKDEFLLAATAQNLRKLAKLIPVATPPVTA